MPQALQADLTKPITDAWTFILAHSIASVIIFFIIFIALCYLFKLEFRRLNYGTALISLVIAVFATALIIHGLYPSIIFSLFS